MLKSFRVRSCFFVILTLCSIVSFLHFTYFSPSQEVAMQAYTAAGEFQNQTASLKGISNDFKLGRATLKDLRTQLSETRKAYKKIEFLLGYYYPGYVEEHINGAPLLHMERYDTRPIVLPPQGLQVLDELIFSDAAHEERSEIAMLSLELYNSASVLVSGFNDRKIEDQEVIEAIRSDLVRIFSMGITGFDTPGSLNATEEARVSMGSLKKASLPFLKSMSPQKANQVEILFDDAIANLDSSAGFDDFDRLHFLREYINPLYAGLLSVKEELGLHGDSKLVSGRNQQSANIFAADFLDPYFYSELSQEEDSKELRALGEKLFYDPMLSANNQMSCGTCHNPVKAFTDGKAKSGSNVVGKTVERNAPTLLNAVYADRYFYDLRAYTLEQQAEHVIFNDDEFNTAYEEILGKLNSDENYKKAFKKTFGKKEVTREHFSKALASYVLSLQSHNSEFDKYVRGETALIDPKIKKGFNLFMGKAACATCHFAPTFSGLMPPFYTKNESEILGVLENPNALAKRLDKDAGRMDNEIYSEESWIFEKSFKTNAVRNVELTAPYFHNGAYKTLHDVVDFYDHGGGLGLGLEVTNQTLPGDSLHLSSREKEALIAFMKSLTDTSGIRNAEIREAASLLK